MERLAKMLGPDESVLIGVPHGSKALEVGRVQRPESRDYFLVTDKRIINVDGRYFLDGTGFKAYPRRLVEDVSSKSFSMGCNVSILLVDRKTHNELTLDVKNCRKAEGEAIVKALKPKQEYNRCPRCTGILEKDYTFCPNCGAPLKTICRRCGKPLAQKGVPCPHCGDA